MDLNLGRTRLILDVCATHGLTLPQAAYLLATACWETAHTMQPVREAYWLSEEWRARNLRYYPWYGRGFVQLTWQVNYARAQNALGRDLTTNPDVVMEPDVSAEILWRGCMAGWFTGRKLTDYVRDGYIDFLGARRVVNGTDRAAEIADLAVKYQAALTADKWGQGAQASPPAANTSRNPLAALFAALLAFFGVKQ
ncbi:glycoside hydrolase family 19 protein [Pseudooceanicola sp. 502str34]